MDDLVRQLRERGDHILAMQLWLALRYPQCGALRAIIARGLEARKT